MTLFTVGHGTRATEELVVVLRDAGVAVLADVRRFPASRRNPQFARGALAADLPAHDVAYEWWGETLGGRRHAGPPERSRHPAWREAAFRAYAEYMDTAEFRDACGRLFDDARMRPTAVMCAETLWWRCHRRLIADAAVLQGFEVSHLGLASERAPHRLHPSVRRGDDGWPVYDGGELIAFDLP
jgi:uncharacterized protein (DUF488 family)